MAMKTKRADFAAAFLRGRMVVAGGLGERDYKLNLLFAAFTQFILIRFAASMLYNPCQNNVMC